MLNTLYHSNPKMKSSEEMSSSSDEESYREKFENVKLLVGRLQSDLQTEMLRSKSVQALAECLDEEREKTRTLSERMKQQERGIVVMQSRLDRHGLDAALTLADGEILRPGTSKSLLESVMAENARLKRNQKYLNVDPARMEQALQDNETLKKQMRYLEEDIAALQEKLDNAKSVLHASDSEKNQRILSLENYIEDLKRNKDTQSVLCNSLSEETTSLRQQLKQTMKQMQDTMHRLEDDSSSSSSSKPRSSTMPLTQQRRGDKSVELAQAQLQIDQLQHDTCLQQRRLQEVVDMNSRWQTFNKQRDQHVQELKQKLSEQRTAGADSEQHQRALSHLQHKVRELEQERKALEEDNRQLRQQIEAQKNELSTLDQEKVHLYEAQIKVITDDFRQERDDRAREHEKAERLEQELSDVKAELERYKRQQMTEYADRRQHSLENHEQQYYQNMYGGNSGRLRNIGLQQAAFVARNASGSVAMRYECDSAQEDSTEQISEDVVDSPSDDTLECPKCSKTFPMDQHGELLEHLDKC